MCKINIDNLSQKELEELNNEVNKKLTCHRIVNIKVAIDRNQKYVGKCYKKINEDGITEFIMVISALSTSEFYLECMVFENEILFERNISKNFHFSPNDIFQGLNYDGIRIEDKPLLTESGYFYEKKKCIDNYTEITQEEYFKEMNQYIDKLQNYLKQNKFNDLSTATNYIKYYE